MRSYCSLYRVETTQLRLKLSIATLLSSLASAFCAAQDITLNVTYICSGEHLYVEKCDTADLSDASACMVGHPDHPGPNGMMTYTTQTRGTLKKLFPTCQQPTAADLARAASQVRWPLPGMLRS